MTHPDFHALSAQINSFAVSANCPGIAEIDLWLLDQSPAVTDALASLIISKHRQIRPATFGHTAERLVPRLFKIACNGSAEVSRFESLEYLRAPFVLLWRRRGPQCEALDDFVRHLRRLLASWPNEKADLALLVVLEHILPMPGVPDLFAEWQTDPVLGEVLKEGLRLAGLTEK